MQMKFTLMAVWFFNLKNSSALEQKWGMDQVYDLQMKIASALHV